MSEGILTDHLALILVYKFYEPSTKKHKKYFCWTKFVKFFDRNLAQDDRSTQGDPDEDKALTPDSRLKGDHETPTKGRSSKKDTLKSGTDSKADKRKTSAKGRAGRRSSAHNTSPPPGGNTTVPVLDMEGR